MLRYFLNSLKQQYRNYKRNFDAILMVTNNNQRIIVCSPVRRVNYGDLLQFLFTIKFIRNFFDIHSIYNISLKLSSQMRFDYGFMAGLTIHPWLQYFILQSKILRRTCLKTILMPCSFMTVPFKDLREQMISILRLYDIIFVRGNYTFDYLKSLDCSLPVYMGVDQILHFCSKFPPIPLGDNFLLVLRGDYLPFYPSVCSKNLVRRLPHRNVHFAVCAENDEKVIPTVLRKKILFYFPRYSKHFNTSNIHIPDMLYSLFKSTFGSVVKYCYSMRLHFGLTMMCLGIPTVLISPVYELKVLDVSKYFNKKCIMDLCLQNDASPSLVNKNLVLEDVASFNKIFYEVVLG